MKKPLKRNCLKCREEFSTKHNGIIEQDFRLCEECRRRISIENRPDYPRASDEVNNDRMGFH